jgi:hypothetical protein
MEDSYAFDLKAEKKRSMHNHKEPIPEEVSVHDSRLTGKFDISTDSKA